MHSRPLEKQANLDAEQAILGAILTNNEAYDVATAAGLLPEHFSEEMHGDVFRAAGKLIDAGKVAHPVTVKTYLPDGEVVSGLTISQYLARLAAEAVTIVNVPDYASAIIATWAVNECTACSQLMAEAALIKDDLKLADELDAIEARFQAARRCLNGQTGEGRSFADCAPQSLQATLDAMSGKTLVGIDYKVPPLMQLIGPAVPGSLIVIGGLTKHGKSALAQQMARGSADQGHPVLYYSGEMDASELTMREKARDTEISVKHQREGKLSDRDAERLALSSQTIGKLPITVQDRRRTIDQFLREARTFCKRHRSITPLIVVDSMLLFDRSRAEYRMSDVEYADYVCDKLKATARDIGVPIVVLGQLKKNTIERDRRYTVKQDARYFQQIIARRPRASDLYGSVEKHADHVVIVYNAEVVLRDLEPAEGTDEYLAWESVLGDVEHKADILLSLSRSAQWPARRTVNWSGVRHHFSFQRDAQQGFF